ncbi:MAG: MFS transporter [Gammaproteobacteria bacterium WSBS_2016_MAG_OTU1]
MPLKELIGVGVLSAAMLFRMFGVFVALPIAALFATGLDGGEAAFAIGLAIGGYGVTQALLQIPAGMLADVCGRKPVLVGMLLVFAAGGFVAADATTVWQLAGGRLLQGCGAVAAVAAAWIADITAPERRAKAMMVYGIGIVLAFVGALFFAPPLAGWLGLAQIFALSGWLGVISAVAVCFLPSPPKQTAESVVGEPLLNRQVVFCAVAAFVSHYVLAALFLQIPLLLNDIWPLPEHWKFYAPTFVLSLFLAVPLIWREKWQFAPFAAMILLAIGTFIILAGEPTLLVLSFGIVLFFSGFVALEAIIPARASRAAPKQKRGAALGVVMSMGFFAMFCGASMSGLLLDVAGETGFLLGTMLLIGGGFVIMRRVGANRL